MMIKTNSATFFEEKYKNNQDPWGFATSEYERNRYSQIHLALQHKNYKQVFEPGCSIGVLTEILAHQAEYVQAIDISWRATLIARRRCANLKNVSIQCQSLLDAVPEINTDLILLSEIGYYFEVNDLNKIAIRLINSCDPSTSIFAAHWLGQSDDHCISGNTVHETIGSIRGLKLEYHTTNENFRIDRWIKTC